MEKNTVLAIILMSLVMLVFYVLQGVFYPPQPPEVIRSETPVTAVELQETPEVPEVPVVVQPEITLVPETPQQAALDSGPQVLERIVIDTELIQVILTNAGGDMVSWKLKEHFDKEEGVNMVLSGDKEAHAFSIAFGGLNAQPVSDLFYVNRISLYSVEFYRDFAVPGSDGTFRLTKRYDFKPRDYMFELTVTLDGGYSVSNFNFDGNAYTLSFGPQIGPRFEKLSIYYDYRNYVAFINGKRKNVKANENIESNPKWAAIVGKYFTFIAVPYLAQYTINFSEAPEAGLSLASRFNIVRPPINISKSEDTYRFYLGPKSQESLIAYNNGKNEFRLIDTNLVEVASSRGILAPLERLLKWLLSVFYKVVPNYGIAIIMLTLLVKICFFPLTKKGSEATLRMQALAPKIKELQEKHKGNPQKLNAEMGEFYRKEGYNPISGCLPMLLQIPIFIAM
jgi:YidC/Oxa1 family membrane protein insertase